MKKKLEKVNPTHSLYFYPFSCELQTASIRNKTVDAIEENDIRAVSYRFLQNRKGEAVTRLKALFCFVCLISFLYKAKDIQWDERENDLNLHVLVNIWICLFLIFNIIPNIFNTRRYRETKNFCEEFLQKNLSEKDFQDIKSMKYNETNFFKINELLDEENIAEANPDNIPKRFRHFG